MRPVEGGTLIAKIDNFLPNRLGIVFQKGRQAWPAFFMGEARPGLCRYEHGSKMRKRAVKLLKSFTGVNLCAGAF
jgi:hypothetical protein